uniref:Uncharacterized protein n=1 Tax=Latimeria chalumnae TaxID=7897 RepID=H3APT7_LATCH
MEKDMFTTAAVDNLDHNPSSTTAKDSFHGIAVSLTNQFSDGCPRVERDRRVADLPPNYSIVALQNKHPIVPPTQGPVKSSGELLPQANEKEQQWLSRLLQLLNKDQHTIQHLNPGQTPVITMDQPLYSLVKQIQWTWLENLGEENYVVMLGGLHIEMAVLHMLGEWLDGSGWSMALIEAGVATSGKAGALISSSHIKQTHYTHQVAVAALHVLRRAAYQSYMELEDSEEPTKAQHYPQFHSWSSHGARVVYVAESNFSLYIDTLDQLMPWFFALDHVNYAHWLPVHIQDMVALKETHRTVLDEFQKGNFVVQQSTHSFLLIALDQSHEQTNKYIKGEGGLTENTAALRRWMVAGPEVARVVAEFEESMGGEESSGGHHEQVPHMQASFAKDVKALVAAFKELGNPFFEDSEELLTLDIKDIMDDTVVKSIRSTKLLGSMPYEAYVAERIANNRWPITDTIRKKLPLFHNPPEKAHSKSQFQTAALKKDCQLFSKLYIACQSRDDGLEQFFAHKNQAEPPSLSSQGRLQMGTKSDLLPCLEAAQEGCGLGSRRCVSGKTAIPRNWAGFLCNNQNKTELFCFLSEKLSEINVGRKELYTTHLDHVLTVHHSDSESKIRIEPCSHEEAGTQMLLHAARQGHSKLLLTTVDTDVVVLAMAQAHHLQVSELWLAFGVGKHYRFIPAHSISSSMGPEKATALPFFHALTGCDITLAFAGRGGKKAWDTWTVTLAFVSLSTCPEQISEEVFDKLECFVVLLFSKTSAASWVNETQQTLFAKGARALENNPRSLMQHVKRAALQAGYVWSQMLLPQPELPSPAVWGWEQTEHGWTPKWTILPEASKACYEL